MFTLLSEKYPHRFVPKGQHGYKSRMDNTLFLFASEIDLPLCHRPLEINIIAVFPGLPPPLYHEGRIAKSGTALGCLFAPEFRLIRSTSTSVRPLSLWNATERNGNPPHRPSQTSYVFFFRFPCGQCFSSPAGISSLVLCTRAKSWCFLP